MRTTAWIIILAACVVAPAAHGDWGSVVSSFPAPGSQAGGLTFDGTYLWYADYATSASTIYKMTTTGSFVGQWTKSIPYLMGLGWDGAYIWADSLTTRYVYRLQPSDASIVSSFYGPSAHMMGLEGDSAYLYINDWSDVRVAKVNFSGALQQLIPVEGPSPGGGALQGNYLWYTTRDFWNPANAKCIKALLTSGSTVASFQCPDSQSPDLTFDGVYLWVSGFTTKYIYKVDVPDVSTVRPSSLGRVKALFR